MGKALIEPAGRLGPGPGDTQGGATAAPDRPLLIGVFIQHYPPRLGGAECQAKLLVSELVRCGHRVELVTTRHSPELPARTSLGLLTIRRLPTLAPRWLKLPLNLVTGFIAGMQYTRTIDLMHGHCLSPFVLGALLAAKLRGTPTLLKICTIGKKGDIAKIQRFGFRRLLWRLYQQADYFVANTLAVENELIAQGVARARIFTVYNMLEQGAHPAAPQDKGYLRRALGLADKLTVLYVGRLHPDKGLGLVMRYWPSMARQYDAQLVLVGEGPLRAQIESWRVAQHLQAAVTLTGYQPDPGPYYRAADVFVFPSESEAFGNAIVEAMSHGLAVVTTRVGVASEWGDETPLAVIDAEFPEDLSRRLDELLRDDSRRRELGERAGQFMSGRFESRAIGEQYIAQYRQMLSESGDRAGSRDSSG